MAGVCLGQGQLGVQPGTLVAGGQADIDYSNPSRPGESVTVVVDDGNPFDPQFQAVTIQLDGNGNGSAKWQVPLVGWNTATFNAPEAFSVSRLIVAAQDGEE